MLFDEKAPFAAFICVSSTLICYVEKSWLCLCGVGIAAAGLLLAHSCFLILIKQVKVPRCHYLCGEFPYPPSLHIGAAIDPHEVY